MQLARQRIRRREWADGTDLSGWGSDCSNIAHWYREA
jgi:hypothetical protein